MIRKPREGSVQVWNPVVDTVIRNRDSKDVKVSVHESVAPEWGYFKLRYQIEGERIKEKYWYGETAHHECIRFVNDLTGNWIHID